MRFDRLALALTTFFVLCGGLNAAPKSFDDYLDALGQRESGGRGDYKATNPAGYLGRYQFGELALVDCLFYEGDSTPYDNDWVGKWLIDAAKLGVKSKDDFLDTPKAQDAAIWRYSELQWRTIVQLKLDQYDGKTIGGVAITKSGMLGGAHLVGAGGLRKFLRSNGQTVPTDGNGTKITEYIQLFASYDVPFK